MVYFQIRANNILENVKLFIQQLFRTCDVVNLSINYKINMHSQIVCCTVVGFCTEFLTECLIFSFLKHPKLKKTHF